MTRGLDGNQLTIEAINLCGKKVLTQEAINAIKKITPDKFAQANKMCRDGLEQILQEHAKSRNVGNRRTASELLQKLRTGDGGQQNGNVWTNGVDESPQDIRLRTHAPLTSTAAPAPAPAPAPVAPVAAPVAPVAAPTEIAKIIPIDTLLGLRVKQVNDLTDPTVMQSYLDAIKQYLDNPDDLTVVQQAGLEQLQSVITRKLATLKQTTAMRNYDERRVNTNDTLVAVQEFNEFMRNKFISIKVDDQVYYVNTMARNSKAKEAIKFIDNSTGSNRDEFIAVLRNTMVGGYQAMATRDEILNIYKKQANRPNLKDAIAFDAEQEKKVSKWINSIGATPADTAKGLANLYIDKQINADQLKASLTGGDPSENPQINELISHLKDKKLFANVTRENLSAVILDILNKKPTAFVMDKNGIAFDGVSMVPGARIKGKNGTTEAFYEVKSSTIDTFITGITDTNGELKATLNKMNNQGPIEFGGKVFEVKDGQVLTLNQPEGSGFSLKDLVPSDFSTQDGLSLMLNVALAIKVWGTPNISLGAGSILSTFGNAVTGAVPSSAPNLSLPHISSTAIKILGAFGLGWWVRGLYDAREIAAGTNVRYINDSCAAYTGITGTRSIMNTTTILNGYSRPSWREFDGVKIYTPLDGTQAFQVGEYTVLVLAINAKGDIDQTRTIVKKVNETPRSVASTGNETTIIDAIKSNAHTAE